MSISDKERGLVDMSKVILTGEQVKALDTAVEEFGFTKVLDLHQSGKWSGRFKSLNNLNDGELRRIFDYGYQTKERHIQEIEKKADDLNDNVNKPNHYHTGNIDVIKFSKENFAKEESKGFYRINAIKYITRYDKKNGIEDLDKAVFYINKLKELESNE